MRTSSPHLVLTGLLLSLICALAVPSPISAEQQASVAGQNEERQQLGRCRCSFSALSKSVAAVAQARRLREGS